MSKTATFGVVGGYGATGRAVVAELVRSTDKQILVGGRDLSKINALPAEFGSRVSALQLDVSDEHSLDSLCSRCSIVVNCAGPVKTWQDRVAQAASRAHCHYVDVAGLCLVSEALLPRAREISDQGLSFVVSAGWLPGLTELIPAYALAKAKTRMNSLDSLTVYFGDDGDWSTNALRDAVWFLHHSGLPTPGYFRKGEWTRVKISEASRKTDLGSPVGVRNFSRYFLPELKEVARGLKDSDVSAYSYLAGAGTAVAGALIALLPLPEALGVRLLRNALGAGSLPVGGFVVAEVVGRADGRAQSLTVRMAFDKGRGYWVNGIVPAIVARLISEGKGVAPGVHFLADAVDPVAFVAELRKAGVELAESFGPETAASC